MEETEAKPGEKEGAVAVKAMPVLSATSAVVLHLVKPPGARAEPVTPVIDFVG